MNADNLITKISKIPLFIYTQGLNLSKGKFEKSDIEEHLPTIRKFVREKKPKIIVELGVRKGETTKAIVSEAYHYGGKIYSCDIDDCSKVSKYYNWEFINFCSLITAHKLKKLIGKVDLLFVDTMDTFEQVTQDLNSWEKFVKKKGTIMIHDTNLSLIYERKNGTMGVANNTHRGAARAIEKYFKIKMVETEDFEKNYKNIKIQHYSTSCGFTIITKGQFNAL